MDGHLGHHEPEEFLPPLKLSAIWTGMGGWAGTGIGVCAKGVRHQLLELPGDKSFFSCSLIE